MLDTYKDSLREGFSKYTRKAFRLLPKLDKPRILDVGCGSGVPTMELARLSDGQIVGLDIDQDALDRLGRKSEEAGLSDRIKTLRCSMADMDFPDESFDVIWAEGSISEIGFETGLKEWRRLLKADGFLVVHDEAGDITEKIEQTSSCGYELLGHFVLDVETWWHEYFSPLEKRIDEVRKKHADNPGAMAELEVDQREIEMVRQNPARSCSAFFIMKKS